MEKLDLPRFSHNIHILEAESSQAVFFMHAWWNSIHLKFVFGDSYFSIPFGSRRRRNMEFFRRQNSNPWRVNSWDFTVQLPPAPSLLLQLLWTSRGINGWKEWRFRNEWNQRKFRPSFGREPGIESCWNLQIWKKIEWTDMKSTKYFWMNWQVLPHKLTSPRKMLPNRELGKPQMFVKSKGSVPKMPEQFREVVSKFDRFTVEFC